MCRECKPGSSVPSCACVACSQVLGLYCRLVMTTMVDLKVKSMPGAMAVARSTMGEVGARVLALSRVFRIRVPPLYGVHGGTTVLDEHAMTKFLQQVKGCMINKYAHYLESVLLLFRVLALITCARAGDEYAAVRRGVSNALPPPHAQEISRCVPARVGVWLLRPLSRPQVAGA